MSITIRQHERRSALAGKSGRSRPAIAPIAAALAFAGACAHAPPPPSSELLTGITHEGYTPNRGLSGLFQPGNLIQTMEMGDDGKPRKLSPPLVLAWASDCFPGLEPRESPFVVEQTSSKKSRNLELSGPDAVALLPGLSFGASGVAGHRLTLQNPRVRAFARADVSGKMSQQCMDAIADAVKSGDRPEWFVLVLESVVVDSLKLEITFESGVKADVRDQVTQQATAFMNTLGQQIGAAGQSLVNTPYGAIGSGAAYGAGLSPGSTSVVGDQGTTVVNGQGTTVVNDLGTTVMNGQGTTVIPSYGDPSAVSAVPAGGRAGRGPITGGARAKVESSGAKGTVIELGAAAVVAYRTRVLQPITQAQ
jgi:hypothetical protein